MVGGAADDSSAALRRCDPATLLASELYPYLQLACSHLACLHILLHCAVGPFQATGRKHNCPGTRRKARMKPLWRSWQCCGEHKSSRSAIGQAYTTCRDTWRKWARSQM